MIAGSFSHGLVVFLKKYFLFHFQKYNNGTWQSPSECMSLFTSGKSHEETEDVSLRPTNHCSLNISKHARILLYVKKQNPLCGSGNFLLKSPFQLVFIFPFSGTSSERQQNKTWLKCNSAVTCQSPSEWLAWCIYRTLVFVLSGFKLNM